MLDELANLNVSPTDTLDSNGGTKESDPVAEEPARWRPRVTLRRYIDREFEVDLWIYTACIVH